MFRTSSTSAAHGATGTRRQRRGAPRRRRVEWVRPFHRVHRAIDESIRLIDSSLRTVAASKRCAHQRPVRTARKLDDASNLLITASAQLSRVEAELAEMSEAITRHPNVEEALWLPDLVEAANERYVEVAEWLTGVSDQVFTLQEDVLHRLETGELVPEPEPQPVAQRRPRIVLVPRPAPVRAFLRVRLRRVVERIAPVLQRRRRTRRPAALSVPRRTSQGRAPPLFPVCLL